MVEIAYIKFYDIETGKEIPMSQEEEAKKKRNWKKILGNFLAGVFGLAVFVGYGLGGGPYGVKKVVITAVDRPGTNI